MCCVYHKKKKHCGLQFRVSKKMDKEHFFLSFFLSPPVCSKKGKRFCGGTKITPQTEEICPFGVVVVLLSSRWPTTPPLSLLAR